MNLEKVDQTYEIKLIYIPFDSNKNSGSVWFSINFVFWKTNDQLECNEIIHIDREITLVPRGNNWTRFTILYEARQARAKTRANKGAYVTPSYCSCL